MGFDWLWFTGRSELQDLLPMVIVSLALKETEIRYPQVCQMEEQVQRDLLPNFSINTSIANSLSVRFHKHISNLPISNKQ